MVFKRQLKAGEFEVVKEGQEEVMRVNYNGVPLFPSIEDNKEVMRDIIEKLIQAPGASRIVFFKNKVYSYDYNQTKILREISNIYNYVNKQKLASNQLFVEYSGIVNYVVFNLLKEDPLGAYVELKRIIREEKINMNHEKYDENKMLRMELFEYILNMLDKTILINKTRQYLDGHVIGDRSIYRNVFRPTITPDFLMTRLMLEPPLEGVELDSYSIQENTSVMIFDIPGDIKHLYHLNPPEFNLDEDKYGLLEEARTVLIEYKPKAEEFIETEKIRQNFFSIGRDLLTELAENKGLSLTYEELEEITRILVRYTIGFGLIEVLLRDEKIQDINVNGPIGETPIFIVHQDYEECVTNIIPSKEDSESWATKFRIISGRPLDEANPVLDTDLVVPGARARVAIVSNPLNPLGLGYSFRRHREKPWTLPLFMKNGMINDVGAGLLSFLIDGSRSILVAGTRGSGKTSFLTSIIIEIMRKYRIITVEDTLELPVKALRDLGYNIQPLKVRAALMAAGGTELAADEGIRTSLRMGDSSLIVGEVRSKEALALYEAMRVGALANVVAGTIHADSPYGLFDRVVNDLGVPKTSFKATDIIVIANPIKSADGLHKKRRIVSITEVRKEWDEDPLKEGAFVDLMRYNPITDKLELTDNMINGDSEIVKAISGSVKEWSGDWESVWENIMLRAKIKQELLDMAILSKREDLLEADFVVKSNDEFHKASSYIYEKFGYTDPKKIFFEWNEWFKKEIKKR